MSRLVLVNGKYAPLPAEQVAAIEAAYIAAFPDRQESLCKAVNDERDKRIYSPVGAISLPLDIDDDRGTVELLVEPDIRNQRDRDNLVALHSRALALQTEGITSPVITFGAADNREYNLTPEEMLKVCQAPFDRASLLYSHARFLKSEIRLTTKDEDLERFDIESGSVDGSGSWPS